MTEEASLAFVESTLDVALPKADGSLDSTYRHALWVIGITILADALLRTPDEFTKERLLRNVQNELREAIAIIPTITA
jgi:hypothetical protein